MLALNSRCALARAINNPRLDPDLRALMELRALQLEADSGRRLSCRTRFVVVEGGDTPDVINRAVGFPMTGDRAEEPDYDWIEDYGLWFEVAYRRRGRRTFIFVENSPATELGVHSLCMSHFWFDDAGEMQ
ncbi:hypothetical protein ASG17_00805 [Brevundimonas sp. Leaf363]|uniref:hypothetical protein n=1 Tax=Brevundimonas sp. Leaf363 TaxID=1736353 RepID=UPI0006F5A262|nr:hypothetical protein [Brevundimonas sp. Leaf363]KQS57307.1 hypothetical protein ASG17_00805 [Brevundimonas sp. Leaf363]